MRVMRASVRVHCAGKPLANVQVTVKTLPNNDPENLPASGFVPRQTRAMSDLTRVHAQHSLGIRVRAPNSLV